MKRHSIQLTTLLSLSLLVSGGVTVSAADGEIIRTSLETVEATSEPAALPAETDTAAALDNSKEVIRERFPSGKTKIEREVTQDEQGNYVNHGSWKQWDEEGNLVAVGQYDMNRRDGAWKRVYLGKESPLFAESPYREFRGAYVSEADFQDGKLNGNWTIYDHKMNKISEIEFVGGKRHGTATWWYIGGQKMQESKFVDGVIDGELVRWGRDGKVLAREAFRLGKKLAPKVEFYENKQKRSEITYSFAKVVIESPDNWWDAKLAVFTTDGSDIRHGAWTMWYSNGQKQQEGKFEDGKPVGVYVSWYSNGQKAIEGNYVDGKPHGRWLWWHKNGQKKTEGHYAAGTPTEDWAWWKETGELVQRADLSKRQEVANENAATSLDINQTSAEEAGSSDMLPL